ncbi:MAG TPA: amidase [Candidatus Dormibacteraeota bacterium]|nr:amidase [Candidatus Dormibacteraeota bacterium]
MSDPVAAVESALARIDASEEHLRAWVDVDRRGARAAASRVASGAPLRGAVVGVKDIFDVEGFPTRCGLPGAQPPAGRDADAVALLRAAGAVILGKTQTTPYAWLDPAPTRNPFDPARTPGGSSAGSAAAVAAEHCTIALGSQTAGSTLRPAAFCGIVGYKPTFGRISTTGVTPLAPSLDHVGIFARTVAEAVTAAHALDPRISAAEPQALRIALDDLTGDAAIEEPARAALGRAAHALREAGFRVTAVSLPPAVRRGGELLATLVAYESIRHHRARWEALGSALPPRLRELLEVGLATSRSAYEEALAEREALRGEIAGIFTEAGVLATPCAPGEAPGRETTGDARYVRPWTFYGVPAIAVPCGRGPHGLPVGVQLAAPAGEDGRLLATALRLEAALAPPR